jgi:hypothetical protein
MAQRQIRRRDDISNNARRLARLADRLPAGKRYVVFLIKPAEKGEAWQVHVKEVGPGFDKRRRAASFPEWL